jgi:hypothetical protein
MRPKLESLTFLNRYQDYVPLWSKDIDSTTRKRKLRAITVVGISFLIILLIPLVFFGFGSSEGTEVVASQGKGMAYSGNWRKPKGLMVVALVFYGRRANVQILERYLRVFYPFVLLSEMSTVGASPLILSFPLFKMLSRCPRD